VVILALLLVVAAGALFLVNQGQAPTDYTLGGPLFPVAVEDIEGLLLTRQGSQYRLDRGEGDAWSLSGDVADYVDTLAVFRLLDTLAGAVGGPLLPGTEVEDRRYGFNGPEAIRLTVFVAGAEPISLALGTANPITSQFYASGAGRGACFPVSAGMRKTLGDLPGSVQARILLPGVSRDRVEKVNLRRSGRDFLILKREGRWWMPMPEEGPGLFGTEIRDYQAFYDDRRTTDGEGTWILASSAAAHQLIYEVSEIIVRDIKSPGQGANLLEAWDLDPPWRQVTLTGKDLNPDPLADSPDHMVIAFGPALDHESVPALRRGHVLVTDLEALKTLEKPLGALIHNTALTFLALAAETIAVEREGLLILRGERTGQAITPEGREAWQTVFPRREAVSLSNIDYHRFSQDLVVNLDRIPILAVLPPTQEPAVLREKERVKITVVLGAGDQARTEVFEIGYLAEDYLPADVWLSVQSEGILQPVGLWFPATGKLLQVPDQVVVTARNLVQFTVQDE
jgi:hypothetical protein